MAESPAPSRFVDIEIKNAAAGGEIGVIYFNDPPTRNAFSLELGMAFNRALDDVATREPFLRALVITGRNGVFSSGGDLALLRSFADKDPAENKEFMYSFYRLFLRVREMPFPVIAAVNGHAIGASLALALACDLRYFEPDAKYAFNFVRIGIHPGMGSTFLAVEAAGMAQAQELLLTGRTVTGQEMLRRGLCHGLYEGDVMLEKALAVAEEIAAAAPLAVRLTKRTLLGIGSALDEALLIEADAQSKTYQQNDFKEAMKAVEEKRPPHFTDA